MVQISPLDWVWIIGFLILMITIGIVFYRLGKRSESDYFLAGRQLPWWLPATSVFATHTATDTPIFVAGVVLTYGISGIWYIIFPIWVAVSAFTSTRIFRRSLAYTIAEWQNLRFSGMGAEMLRGWFGGWQFFICMFVLGWVGAAMGKVINLLFGWPAWYAVVGLAVLCAIYVLAAGYWGVIMADFQQGIVTFLMIIIVSVWGIMAAGGPKEIIQKITHMKSSYLWSVPKDIKTSNEGKFKVEGIIPGMPPKDVYSESQEGVIFLGTNDQKSNMQVVEPSKEDMLNNDNSFNLIFPGSGDTVLTGKPFKVVWTTPKDIENVKLYYSVNRGTNWTLISDAVRNGQAWRLNPFNFSGWFSGDFPIAWFLTMIIIATLGGIGIGTNTDWFVEAQRLQSAKSLKEASVTMWAGGMSVFIRNGIWVAAILGLFTLVPNFVEISKYETIWYNSGFIYLPLGLVGMFIAAIIAIHLSTISTRLNLGAMYATRDIYHHYINPNASEQKLVWVGRITTAILLLGSIVYGMMITQITQWLIFAMWIMMAGVWLPNILHVIWWRFNAWGYLSAWISSLAFSWLVVWILPQFGIIPHLPTYLQFWVLLVLGVLVFIPVTFLTKPEKMGHLVKFYVMTRPIGWWKPVKEEAIKRGLI